MCVIYIGIPYINERVSCSMCGGALQGSGRVTVGRWMACENGEGWGIIGACLVAVHE